MTTTDVPRIRRKTIDAQSALAVSKLRSGTDPPDSQRDGVRRRAMIEMGKPPTALTSRRWATDAKEHDAAPGSIRVAILVGAGHHPEGPAAIAARFPPCCWLKEVLKAIKTIATVAHTPKPTVLEAGGIMTGSHDGGLMAMGAAALDRLGVAGRRFFGIRKPPKISSEK